MIEAMWFVLSRNVSQSALAMSTDDDRLIQANANQAEGSSSLDCGSYDESARKMFEA